MDTLTYSFFLTAIVLIIQTITASLLSIQINSGTFTRFVLRFVLILTLLYCSHGEQIKCVQTHAEYYRALIRKSENRPNQDMYALQCVQCFSLFHQPCDEGNVKPKNCSGNAQFCMKFVGEYPYGTITWRDCETKQDRNNTCETLTISNENVRVCYSICNTDGCNTATGRRPFILYALLLLAFSVGVIS